MDDVSAYDSPQLGPNKQERPKTVSHPGSRKGKRGCQAKTYPIPLDQEHQCRNDHVPKSSSGYDAPSKHRITTRNGKKHHSSSLLIPKIEPILTSSLWCRISRTCVCRGVRSDSPIYRESCQMITLLWVLTVWRRHWEQDPLARLNVCAGAVMLICSGNAHANGDQSRHQDSKQGED